MKRKENFRNDVEDYRIWRQTIAASCNGMTGLKNKSGGEQTKRKKFTSNFLIKRLEVTCHILSFNNLEQRFIATLFQFHKIINDSWLEEKFWGMKLETEKFQSEESIKKQRNLIATICKEFLFLFYDRG